MRLKEKNLLQKFAATLKKFSAQGAKKVEYGMSTGIFLGQIYGLVIDPCFSQIETEIPKFYSKSQSDFVVHFGENFMKIAPKLTKLLLITFRFVIGFDEYFKILNIFNCSKMYGFPCCWIMILNDYKVK